MKVVFLEDVDGVAQGGDVKEVKNGFARNYLIPKNLALPADRDVMQRINRLKRQSESTRVKRLEDMKALSQTIDGKQINIAMRAGEKGRLFGSVTNSTVADELGKLTGNTMDRKMVLLTSPLRKVGNHSVAVKLHSEVTANISVVVHPLDITPEDFLNTLSTTQEIDEPSDETVTDGVEVATDKEVVDSPNSSETTNEPSKSGNQ